MHAVYNVSNFEGMALSEPASEPRVRSQNRVARESIGNPLNMSFGRRPQSAGAGRRPSSESGARREQQQGARPGSAQGGRLPRSEKTLRGEFAPVGTSAAAAAASSLFAQEARKGSEPLTFYAYFLEPLLEHDSRGEPYYQQRVRKCVVSFYHQDGTVAIDEPRQRNSGMVQGRLLKRSHVRHRDEKRAFAAEDFRVGSSVDVLGRSFCLVDACTRTRAHYERVLRAPLQSATEYPPDDFVEERARLEAKYAQHAASSNSMHTAQASSRSSATRAANLASSASSPLVWDHSAQLRKSTSSRLALSQQMPAHTQEVLHFHCAYQDDRPLSTTQRLSDRRFYTLVYYLLDETLEIKECRTPGVQSFKNLLRRGRLPRDALSNPDNPLVDPTEVVYVTWEDLVCGNTIHVWGRAVLLLSCDKLTEAWYASRGVTQRNLQVSPDDVAVFPTTLPPFNGYGAENDLYAMALSLRPGVIKSTQADFERFVQADNKVLRFEVALHEGGAPRALSELDRSRVFVVNYYLGDDTIAVFEPPVRNSGLEGGVFLARARYKKHIPDQRIHERQSRHSHVQKKGVGSVLSRWLRPADFYEGATIGFEVASTGWLVQTFKVARADDYTKRVEREKNVRPGSAVKMLVERLAERLCAARAQVRDAFRTAAHGEDCMPEDVFCNTLSRLVADNAQGDTSLTLGQAQLDEICWTYSQQSEDGASSSSSVRHEQFVDALVLAAPTPVVPEMRASSTSQVSRKSLEKSVLQALRAQLGRDECNNGLLRLSFKEEEDASHGPGVVDSDAWFRVLRKHKLHGVLTRTEAEQLKQRYTEPSAMRAGVEYARLCDQVCEGNFQDYMAQLLMVLPERGDHAKVDLERYRASQRGARGSAHEIPTVSTYLARVNSTLRDCQGDVLKQLENSLKAFASAFGRKHRQLMLRKNLISFDQNQTGTCNRTEFVAVIERIIGEGYCELDVRDQQLFFHYVFPNAWTRQPYLNLLDLMVARDVAGITQMHQAATQQREDPRFLFR